MDSNISMEQCSTCPCPERQRISIICLDIPLPSSQSSLYHVLLCLFWCPLIPLILNASKSYTCLWILIDRNFKFAYFCHESFLFTAVSTLSVNPSGKVGSVRTWGSCSHPQYCFFSQPWPWVVRFVIASSITSFHHWKVAIKISDKLGGVIRSVSNFTV